MNALLAIIVVAGVVVFVLHKKRPDLLQKVIDKVLPGKAAAPTPPPVNPPVEPVAAPVQPTPAVQPKPYDPTPVDFSPLPPSASTPPPGGPNVQTVPPVSQQPEPAPEPSQPASNPGALPPDTSSTLFRRTPCAIALDLKVRTQVKWVKIPEIHAGPTGAIVDGVPNPTPQGFAWLDPGPHTLVFSVPGHNMAIQIV